MKHCPECNKNYADPTLSFCLQDGSPLIYGQAVEEPATAILHETDASGEAPTRVIDPHTTAAPEIPLGSKSPAKTIVWVVAGLAVLFVLGSVFGYRYYMAANATRIDSIAVLPFENGSGNPELDYLSDGVSETLIDKLSQLPDLKVISRNSSFKFRGPNVDIKDAAAKLGVRALVTGKVSRVGDNLTVRIEMIDASQDRQIWSEQYQVKAANVLAVQREIAQEALENLRTKLTGEEQRRIARPETTNPQAYDALLKARFYRNKGGRENRRKALDQYLQAVSADPTYALAYAELADLYAILANQGELDPREGTPKAEAAAQRAVELDGDLAEAHTALGYIRMNAWNWEAARSEFLRARELNPNNSRTRDLYSGYLIYMGRHDEAIAESRRAVELSPLTLGFQIGLAANLLNSGRYDDALDTLNKVRQLDPNLASVYVQLGYVYAAKNMHNEAVAAYKESIKISNAESTSTECYLGASLARLGDRSGALKILEKLEVTKDYVSPGELAVLYTALGDREKALSTLERAYREHDLQLKYLNIETGYDDLRSEPRFQELVRKVGLPV